MIAAGFASGSVRIFQPDDAEVLADIQQRSAGIGALAFAPNGAELYTLSDDGHLVAYRTDDVSKLGEGEEMFVFVCVCVCMYVCVCETELCVRGCINEKVVDL